MFNFRLTRTFVTTRLRLTGVLFVCFVFVGVDVEFLWENMLFSVSYVA